MGRYAQNSHSTLFTSVGAFGAIAADGIGEAPFVDVPVGFDWTGAFVGAQTGYGWGTADGVGCVSAGVSCNSLSGHVDGFLAGVYQGSDRLF